MARELGCAQERHLLSPIPKTYIGWNSLRLDNLRILSRPLFPVLCCYFGTRSQTLVKAVRAWNGNSVQTGAFSQNFNFFFEWGLTAGHSAVCPTSSSIYTYVADSFSHVKFSERRIPIQFRRRTLSLAGRLTRTFVWLNSQIVAWSNNSQSTSVTVFYFYCDGVYWADPQKIGQ